MKVFFFWEPVGGLTLEHRCNPYAGLLALALEKLDIHLVLGEYAFERDWLEKNRTDFDVLHLNWLNHFYKADNLDSALERFTHFAENLLYARSLGYRIVWTVHNLFPHERPYPALDRLANLAVSQLAHEVIVHCEYAADLMRKMYFRTENLHVIPHGHYIDLFPNEVSRQEARTQLQIPEQAFVYLFFGNARVYKGVERLIEAFGNVAGEDALLLLMLRQSVNPHYVDELEALTTQDERIRVFTSTYFAHADFQIYLNAADVAVLPFSAVLTSGSAIAALSFGKPVILSSFGCLPELIDETMGILYNPQDARGLEDALIEIRNRDLTAAGQSALEHAKRLDWSGIASQLMVLYEHSLYVSNQ